MSLELIDLENEKSELLILCNDKSNENKNRVKFGICSNFEQSEVYILGGK